MRYYLFDIDGSLFFSDELNKESYNYALRKFGYEGISCCGRLTRSIVKRRYPRMSRCDFDKIVAAKQGYFAENISSLRENKVLLDLLKIIGPGQSSLWTSGSKERVERILRAFSLEDSFSRKFYSLKQDIPKEVSRICTALQCAKENISVFENDSTVAAQLSDYGVSCLVVIPWAGIPEFDRKPDH